MFPHFQSVSTLPLLYCVKQDSRNQGNAVCKSIPQRCLIGSASRKLKNKHKVKNTSFTLCVFAVLVLDGRFKKFTKLSVILWYMSIKVASSGTFAQSMIGMIIFKRNVFVLSTKHCYFQEKFIIVLSHFREL